MTETNDVKTFYRRADISKADAAAQLLAREPGAKLVGEIRTERATRDTARTAGVRPGERVYAADLRLAGDGPPFEKKDADSDGEDEAVVDLTSDSDSGSDDSGDSDSGEKEGTSPSESDSEGEEPKELTGEDKIIDLLTQLVDAVNGGASLGPDDPMADPMADDPAGLGPDPALDAAGPPAGPELGIGAPAQGETLPPPVPPKHGPAAFAAVASAKRAVLVRRDVTSAVKTSDLVREAQAEWPTHKVARVERTGIGEIKGVKVDLPAHKIALVTLERK
jgi:hypothetical protein